VWIRFTVEFEWDPAKRAANLAKHGLDFRDSRYVSIVARA
jgi:uncharacterized DUF497 family protein